MGLFDFFRSKIGDSDRAMQDEMKRLAPILFPGGHAQILTMGRSISGMLDARIPADAASHLYASAKYLAHTAQDRGRQGIVDFIVRRGMGRISESEAAAIYDRFIVDPPSASTSSSTTASRIDTELVGRQVHLQNASRTFRIDATMFAALLLGLRATGWKGCANLFSQDGRTLQRFGGVQSVSKPDARDMAIRLLEIVETRDLKPADIEAIEPLAVMAAEGSFSFYLS